LNINVEAMTVTLIDAKPQEFIHLTLTGAVVKLKEYVSSQELLVCVPILVVRMQERD
jgi:hypothetical protein